MKGIKLYPCITSSSAVQNEVDLEGSASCGHRHHRPVCVEKATQKIAQGKLKQKRSSNRKTEAQWCCLPSNLYHPKPSVKAEYSQQSQVQVERSGRQGVYHNFPLDTANNSAHTHAYGGAKGKGCNVVKSKGDRSLPISRDHM